MCNAEAMRDAYMSVILGQAVDEFEDNVQKEMSEREGHRWLWEYELQT